MNHKLLFFERTDTVFVGHDHARQAGVKNAFEQPIHLLLDLDQLCTHRLGLRLCLAKPVIPRFLERCAWLQYRL